MSMGVVVDGERLSREAGSVHLRRGFERMLRRIRATGARQPSRLERCAFRVDDRPSDAFDEDSARAVDGAEAVDPTPVVCPKGVCHAVMGDALVFRDDNHLTATHASTLSDWLDGQLPASS